MSFKAAKCPECGGELQVPDNMDTIKCMYCGANIIVREAIRAVSTVNIESFLSLANTAAEAGNNEEAYRYYSSVLETDPTCVPAWLGKGKTAAWQSTLANPRHNEILAAFDQAITFTPPEASAKIRLECANAIASFASAFYRLAFDHMVEFIAVDNSGPQFAKQCFALISMLKKGLTYVENHPPILRELIVIYNRLSFGGYVDLSSKAKILALFTLTDSAKNECNLALQQYISIMKQLDSTYVPPKGPKKTACYIATATMGSYNHPLVCELQLFRDGILLRSTVGKAIVYFYNLLSPPCAGLISKSSVLKALSFFAVVMPALLLSRLITNSRNWFSSSND